MVYDITRKSSFDEVKNYWYQQLKDNAPKKLIIAIAGNKSDLYENEEVEEETAKAFAKVKFIYIISSIQEINAVFKTTSAKNANGIDDLFKGIGNKFIDPSSTEDSNPEDEQDVKKIRHGTVRINDKKKGEEEKKKKCC